MIQDGLKGWLALKSDLSEKQEAGVRYEAVYNRTDSGFMVSWEETASGNQAATDSRFVWDSKKQILVVSRKGERTTDLSYNVKEETNFSVETEFGVFDGMVRTRHIDIEKEEKSLCYHVYIDYDLVFREQSPQRNKMEMFFCFLEENNFFEESSQI